MTARFATAALTIVTTVVLIVGCGDDHATNSGVGCFEPPVERGFLGLTTYEACGGELHVSPNPLIFPHSEVGTTDTQELELTNLSTRGEVIIESADLVETSATRSSSRELSRGDDWFEYARLRPGQTRVLTVQYSPNDNVAATGGILLDVTGDDSISGLYEIQVSSVGAQPDIAVERSVEFDLEPNAGPNPQFRTRAIENVGQADLRLESARARGDAFSVKFYRQNPSDVITEEIDPADEVIPPGETLWYRVFFTPDEVGDASGSLTIESNDPDEPTIVVEFAGELRPGCMEVSPDSVVRFGSTPVGDSSSETVTIRNCSADVTLEVSSLEITDDSGNMFALYLDEVPPLQVLPGQEERVYVVFQPTNRVAQRGELTIKTNDASAPVKTLALEGVGVSNTCPTAVATASANGVPPGREIVVEPQDVVSLDGGQSSDPTGSIVRYEWSLVSQPQGSGGVRLFPDASIPNPSLRIDSVGIYVVELSVFDSVGAVSCEKATVTIHAVPDADFVAMLTWNTPDDPDLRDDSGADLDLHFKRSTGPWNTPPDDIFWDNITADWGDAGPLGDPVASYLDDNGAGPEIIEVSDLQDGTYNIGVYYFSDAGFGSSTATLRTYVNRTVGPSWTQQLVDPLEFWHIADLVWSPVPTVVPVLRVSNGFP